MSDDFMTQLWSGTYGALFGAILGGAVAVLIVLLTNHSQSKSAQRALDERARASRDLLSQQALASKAALDDQKKAQRKEKRETREFEAVAQLLQFMTSLLDERPDDLGFVSELVRRCDQLTLSSHKKVAKNWRTTFKRDQLGVSRHPFAETIATAIALQQVRVTVQDRLAIHFGGPPPRDLIKRFLPRDRRFSWDEIVPMFNSASAEMLNWQYLSNDAKIAVFKPHRERVKRAAENFVVGIYLLESVGSQSIPRPRMVGSFDSALGKHFVLNLGEKHASQSLLISRVAWTGGAEELARLQSPNGDLPAEERAKRTSDRRAMEAPSAQ